MEDPYEREVRAARNQAIFRAINEKLRQINQALAQVSGRLVIACECADTGCVETLEIEVDEYLAVRGNPRCFVVLPGHVYPDAEDVVGEGDRHVVVEKHPAGAEVAEATQPNAQPHGRRFHGRAGVEGASRDAALRVAGDLRTSDARSRSSWRKT